ncbi:hypothetical protein [Flavobacterium tegetincola]|uniref:hypothetical protein n=1 Tax=Flavobacterium tegetincola TaxID=150172 RepID=UPI000414BCD7|nr:hypothetical protein [Flavobacterium tegetincola]
MKKLLLLNALLFSVLLFGQNDFKKGYYIDNQGIRVEGYLKTFSFGKSNDDSFENLDFKKDLNATTEKISKNTITTFGFGTDLKYQKMTVQLDDTNLFKDFSSDKDFLLKTKVVFLNVLMEGKANLFGYEGINGTKFFYSITSEKAPAKQLLYKKYYKSGKYLTESTDFREQLFKNVMCSDQTFNDFLTIKYSQDSLLKVFSKYNSCNNSSTTVYSNTTKKKFTIRVAALAGYTFAKLQLQDLELPVDEVAFGSVQFGAEGEAMIFSDNIALFATVKFSSASASVGKTFMLSEFNTTEYIDRYTLDGNFIDFVIGIRYYQTVSRFAKLYAGAGFGVNNTSGKITRTFVNTDTSFENTATKANLGDSAYGVLQIGGLINNHYAVEFSYDTTKDIVGTPNLPGTSSYKQFSVAAKYIF